MQTALDMQLCELLSPGWQGKHISTLHFGAPEKSARENLALQQQHRLPPLADIAELLDGVGHVLVPPAVVAHRRMPAQGERQRIVNTWERD